MATADETKDKETISGTARWERATHTSDAAGTELPALRSALKMLGRKHKEGSRQAARWPFDSRISSHWQDYWRNKETNLPLDPIVQVAAKTDVLPGRGN